MSREEFGSRRVVVFRTRTGPGWLVYCPCCNQDIDSFWFHRNAMHAARVHARGPHVAHRAVLAAQ